MSLGQSGALLNVTAISSTNLSNGTSSSSDSTVFSVIQLLSVVPIGMNVLVVLAVLRDVNLRSKCNFLIAGLSVSNIVTCIGSIIFSIVNFDNVTFMSQPNCFYLCLPETVGIPMLIWFQFALGVDRLLSVRFPMTYKFMPKTKYTIGMYTGAVCLVVIIVGLGATNIRPSMSVSDCSLKDALLGSSFNAFSFSAALLSIVTLIFYTVSFASLRTLSSGTTEDVFNRKKHILVSMGIIFAFYFIFSFLSSIVSVVFGALPLDPMTKEDIGGYFGLSGILSAGSDFVVFWIRSPEYRRAFRAILGLKPNQITNSNTCDRSLRVRYAASKPSGATTQHLQARGERVPGTYNSMLAETIAVTPLEDGVLEIRDTA